MRTTFIVGTLHFCIVAFSGQTGIFFHPNFSYKNASALFLLFSTMILVTVIYYHNALQ